MNEVLALLNYTTWATTRLLAALDPLPSSELERDLLSSHGGIAGTLAHLYGADVIWTARLRGDVAPTFADLPPLLPLDALAVAWAALSREQQTLAAAAAEDQIISYSNLRGEPQRSTVGEMLRHLVNHASYHRGQIVTMLRQLGYPAPNTDLIAFYRLQAGK